MAGLRGQSRIPNTRDPRARRNSANLASTVSFIDASEVISLTGEGHLTVTLKSGGNLVNTSGELAVDPAGADTNVQFNDSEALGGSASFLFNGTNVVVDDALVVAPGSDTDVNLISVTVTGTPVLSWDESADAFVVSKGLNVVGDLDHDGTNVGFFGVAPTTRPTSFTQTFSAATKTHSNLTSATLTDNSGGTADTTVAAITNANNAGSADVVPTADAIADLTAQVNALRVDLENTKQVLNQAVDDLQTLGLLQ